MSYEPKKTGKDRLRDTALLDFDFDVENVNGFGKLFSLPGNLWLEGDNAGPYLWAGTAGSLYHAAALASEPAGRIVGPDEIEVTDDPHYSPEGYAYRAKLERERGDRDENKSS